MNAPVPSSSVLVVREGPRRLEVLLGKRSESAPIYRGLYVFPGGCLSQVDFDLARAEPGSPGRNSRNSPPLPFFIGALRELFEETGILYCRGLDGKPPDLSCEEARSPFSEYRKRISEDSALFRQMIQERKLNLALDLLLPFSHWITPSNVGDRFETHFFLAVLLPGQEAVEDGTEISQLDWIDPVDVLLPCQRANWPLLAPTLANLRILADYAELKSLLRDYTLS